MTALRLYLTEQQQQLGLGGVTVLAASGQERVHVKDPALADLPLRSAGETQLKRGLAGHDVTSVREVDGADLVDAVTPIWSARDGARIVAGLVVVSTHVPERLEAKVRGISQAFKEYKQLRLLKTPIKVNLLLFFVLITLMIVFCVTWFGLYLARGITGPIEQLVEGTREMAAGNLNYKVQTRADDEIGVLVDSFNRMTDDLSLSKRQLEEAYLDLQDKHTELEERRRYIETVLEAITTGVVSFDAVGRLTTINRAAARMFDLSEDTSVGRLLEEVFRGPEGREIVSLVRRAGRDEGRGRRPPRSPGNRRATRLSLLASVTALRGPEGGYGGAVLVFDDLTELIKAQRQAAWREVAQRLAHEIKNPLTPIQLSAQRLRRRLAGQERGAAAAGERVHGDHHPGGRQPEAAGGGVLALRPHARPDPAPHRHPPHHRVDRQPLPRVASGPHPLHPPRRGPARAGGGCRPLQAGGAEPRRQRGRCRQRRGGGRGRDAVPRGERARAHRGGRRRPGD